MIPTIKLLKKRISFFIYFKIIIGEYLKYFRVKKSGFIEFFCIIFIFSLFFTKKICNLPVGIAEYPVLSESNLIIFQWFNFLYRNKGFINEETA
jgi:hypothetical protein